MEYKNIYFIINEENAKTAINEINNNKFIGVGINDKFTGFAIKNLELEYIVFVFNNITFKSYIQDIFKDNNIIKYISKPIEYIKSLKFTCNNCKYYDSNFRLVSQMNQELIKLGYEGTKDIRAGYCALTIMKYLNKKQEDLLFNKNRDCLLLYLTAFNDLLSQNGPMSYNNLIEKINMYPYLCRTNMNPSFALMQLIKSKALNNDMYSTIISLPE